MDETTETTERVTNDQLDAALDGVAGEVEETVETVEPDDTPVAEEEVKPTEDVIADEPEDNATRTRLGRKVKDLETRLAEQARVSDDRLNALITKFESVLDSRTEVEEELVDMSDPAEVRRLATEAAKAAMTEATEDEKNAGAKYERDYIDTFRDIGSEETEESLNGIYDVMYEKFNKVHTGDAVKDAAKNFILAKAVYESDKKKPSPLKQETAVDTAVETGTTATTVSKSKLPKLSVEEAGIVDDTARRWEERPENKGKQFDRETFIKRAYGL